MSSVEKMKVIVKAEQRNQIIRAVNYSIMNLDKLREQAIKERVTIGEIYLKIQEDGKCK